MTFPRTKTSRFQAKGSKKLFRRIDIFMMVALPILAFVLTLSFRANLLIATLLFFGLPSIYLSIRNSRVILKTSIFALLFSMPLTFIFDYLAARDGAWYIVESVFPFRLFGVVTVEMFIWSYLCIYFVVSMYEHFFDRRVVFQKDRIVSKRMLFFGLIAFFVAFIMMGLILINASIVVIPYVYAFLGITIWFIPLLLFLWHFPYFYKRFIKITAYFFFVSILVEYAGLRLNQWIFPGVHYLWKVEHLGLSIPIEEMIFYIMLSAPGLLTYYEYFDDDRK